MPSATVHDLPSPIHPLVATVAAPACALGDQDGQIRVRGVAGLYVSDARVLRGAEIDVNGVTPDGLAWDTAAPTSTRFHATIRGLGDPSPDPTLRVDRTRTVHANGMDETIRVRSTAVAPLRLTLSLRLAPDLTPLATARSGHDGLPTAVRIVGDGFGWTRDGVTVTTTMPGAALTDTATASWTIDLHHGGEVTVGWSLRVAQHAPFMVAPSTPPTWSCPIVTAADPRLGRLVNRALGDLASLRLADATAPQDAFIAAGVPWFLTLFGRDSLWAARMMLPLGTELAETTLRTLARYQGTRVRVESGEEPGKIMHELRRDDARVRPTTAEPSGPAVYYGTIDATMLWISLLADAWRWGLPAPTVAAFLPNLHRALAWLADYADPTGSGFASYVDRSGRGLANQGWKDSGTAVRFHDGTMAEPPIALCEVQGYAHRAARDGAELLDAFDQPGADQWRDRADRLVQRFRDRFWVSGPLGHYPAEALDAKGRPVDALTSNIGHLLGTGLLSADEESTVAAVLGTPSLAGGYGLRTMSDHDAAFDPLSYHCGSIWPHDTAITLLGLATMPGDANARAALATLSDGLLAAAEAFDYRLPELYSGDARSEAGRPLPHPAACRPQAWSAAAAVALLQALLGLSADAPNEQLSVVPMTSGPLTVSNLSYAGAPLAVSVDADSHATVAGKASATSS